MKRAKLKFLIKRLLREQNALSPLSEPRKPQMTTMGTPSEDIILLIYTQMF